MSVVLVQWGRFNKNGPWHIFLPDEVNPGRWGPACNPWNSRLPEQLADLADRPTPNRYGYATVCHAGRWSGGCRSLLAAWEHVHGPVDA